MQIETLTDKELNKYRKVTVVAGRDKKGRKRYVFNRKKIILPRTSLELTYTVTIDSCKTNGTLILHCSVGKSPLFGVESEYPIESISAIKDKRKKK